jgi:transposase-like protein
LAARERAILALLAARTIGEAAQQFGVNDSTLRWWLSDDTAFQSGWPPGDPG